MAEVNYEDLFTKYYAFEARSRHDLIEKVMKNHPFVARNISKYFEEESYKRRKFLKDNGLDIHVNSHGFRIEKEE